MPYISSIDYKTLIEIAEKAKCLTANFGTIAPDDNYPTNELEADRFIKKRISLWLSSWIQQPLAQILRRIDPDATQNL